MNEILLQVNKKYDQQELIGFLVDKGYQRAHNTNLEPGSFFPAGENISIMSTNSEYPTRLEFFGKILESIVRIDKTDGRRVEKLDSFLVMPNILLLNDKSKVKPGNLVVHEDYGIGEFYSLSVKNVNGQLENYINLRYFNNEVLYLPLAMKEKLSLYLGVGRRKPKLSKLGSATWQKTYKRTYENVLILAKELLVIYAKRSIEKSPIWKINQKWNNEIVKTFGFKETNDQKQAIIDTFEDLKKTKPMDRLICGDVGFGKTEVAIRASSQGVANGYQIAILVPTTILVEQHFATFKKRFANLPVNISRISRLVDGKEQVEIMKELQAGRIDILIGTHKLLNSKIKYKNLGLLVIDEEQKFGVKQKEKLKQFKASVNVLSLTATPIPRTLFMALSGIRDISSINEPPFGRREIITKVFKYDEDEIKKAIGFELQRGGQIYYLHNEVQTIEGTKIKLEKLFPGANIQVGHGQMGEKTLAKIMTDFTEGVIKILVCSTIIENGLDLANANTLIVEDSDKFGLSQLYQIRGRIGRGEKQAYAFFTYADKKITANAFKRLRSLTENTELGSGYNIALSDLEIRGGGNVLGKEQHGNMEAVGLVLYTKLLGMAVDKIKKGLS